MEEPGVHTSFLLEISIFPSLFIGDLASPSYLMGEFLISLLDHGEEFLFLFFFLNHDEELLIFLLDHDEKFLISLLNHNKEFLILLLNHVEEYLIFMGESLMVFDDL